jgi:hypothetical protein
MASNAKKKTTMAKLNRERKPRERRAGKSTPRRRPAGRRRQSNRVCPAMGPRWVMMRRRAPTTTLSTTSLSRPLTPER